nr:MAG TPA: hypothetical protein [Caudoviricetes sp.]
MYWYIGLFQRNILSHTMKYFIMEISLYSQKA